MGVPASRKWINDIIEANWTALNSAENYHLDKGNPFAAMMVLTKYNGQRCYVHIYCNPAKKNNTDISFMNGLLEYKSRRENGLTVAAVVFVFLRSPIFFFQKRAVPHTA